MRKNTWGFQFVKVDVEKDVFKTLLGLNIGDEEKTRTLFNEIKEEYVENQGKPDCILDLLDEEDSIVDDIALTKEQVVEISKKFGHKIN